MFTRNKLKNNNGENKTILSIEKMDVYWLRYVGINIFYIHIGEKLVFGNKESPKCKAKV